MGDEGETGGKSQRVKIGLSPEGQKLSPPTAGTLVSSTVHTVGIPEIACRSFHKYV